MVGRISCNATDLVSSTRDAMLFHVDTCSLLTNLGYLCAININDAVSEIFYASIMLSRIEIRSNSIKSSKFGKHIQPWTAPDLHFLVQVPSIQLCLPDVVQYHSGYFVLRSVINLRNKWLQNSTKWKIAWFFLSVFFVIAFNNSGSKWMRYSEV